MSVNLFHTNSYLVATLISICIVFINCMPSSGAGASAPMASLTMNIYINGYPNHINNGALIAGSPLSDFLSDCASICCARSKKSSHKKQAQKKNIETLYPNTHSMTHLI